MGHSIASDAAHQAGASLLESSAVADKMRASSRYLMSSRIKGAIDGTQRRSGSNENDVLVSQRAENRTVAQLSVGDNIVTAQAGQSWQPLSLARCESSGCQRKPRRRRSLARSDARTPSRSCRHPLGHAHALLAQSRSPCRRPRRSEARRVRRIWGKRAQGVQQTQSGLA